MEKYARKVIFPGAAHYGRTSRILIIAVFVLSGLILSTKISAHIGAIINGSYTLEITHCSQVTTMNISITPGEQPHILHLNITLPGESPPLLSSDITLSESGGTLSISYTLPSPDSQNYLFLHQAIWLVYITSQNPHITDVSLTNSTGSLTCYQILSNLIDSGYQEKTWQIKYRRNSNFRDSGHATVTYQGDGQLSRLTQSRDQKRYLLTRIAPQSRHSTKDDLHVALEHCKNNICEAPKPPQPGNQTTPGNTTCLEKKPENSLPSNYYFLYPILITLK